MNMLILNQLKHWKVNFSKSTRILFFVFISSIAINPIYTQNFKQFSIGSNLNDFLSGVIIQDSGVILCGWTYSNISFDKSMNSKGESDYWIVKVNNKGEKIWDKSYGGSNQDILTKAIKTKDNNIILGGHSNSNSSFEKTLNSKGGKDIWIVKIDSNGNKIWDQTIGGNRDDELIDIVELKNGDLLLLSQSGSSISGDKSDSLIDIISPPLTPLDVWLVKLDNMGNKIIDTTLGSKSQDYAYSIIEFNNKFLMLAKVTGFGFAQLIALDPNFNILSDTTIYQYNNFYSPKLFNTNDSGFLLTYSTGNLVVKKYDKILNPKWSKYLVGNGMDFIQSLHQMDDGYLLGTISNSGYSINKSSNSFGDFDFWLIKMDSFGNKLWDITLGGDQREDLAFITHRSEFVQCFGYSKSNKTGSKSINSLGSEDFWAIEFKEPKKILGSVFPDFNNNCLYNKSSEYTIPKFTIFNKTENSYAITNDSTYIMYLFDRDTAVLKIINLDSNLYVACGKDSIVVDMTGKTDTSGVDFPIRSNKSGHCINITSFSSGLLRPGRWGDYQLNYQNNAFDTAYNAYIEIEVDTAAIDTIKSPYSFTLTGNVLGFNLGHVRPFGFSSVTYSIKLRTSVIIGSSHCHRAKVFPICNLYPSTVYDSSEIQPMMRCLPNDTVEFTLKNIGLRDQKDWGHSIIYMDDLMMKKDSFKLTVGNSRVFKYRIDTNKVFTAEVFNSNFHPVTPILIRHNDLCANKRPMIPSNPALNFSRHDEAKEYEEACTIVRGSYDPNIKSVQPVGMFAEHYTSTGTELKYRIDFQNTGTDTAFRVVLVDTLSSFLNIASFVPGVSSHPYSVEFGGRAVKFIFDPIILIDSGTNEPASHGYVHFKIKHISGITPKTKIENKADIYFDYNAPVRTNTVFNTIFDTIQIYVPKASDTVKGKDTTKIGDTTKAKDSILAIQGLNQTSILVFPNPTTDKFFIQMSEPFKDLTIEIYDMQGRMIKTVSSPNNQTIEVSAQGMTKGIYHIRCMSGEKLITVKKVMVE